MLVEAIRGLIGGWTSVSLFCLAPYSAIGWIPQEQWLQPQYLSLKIRTWWWNTGTTAPSTSLQTAMLWPHYQWRKISKNVLRAHYGMALTVECLECLFEFEHREYQVPHGAMMKKVECFKLAEESTRFLTKVLSIITLNCVCETLESYTKHHIL